MTDPIADLLTRLRNGLAARHATISLPHSKIKLAIAELLVAAGYVESVEVIEQAPQKVISIKLKYKARAPFITELRRVSKPGRRIYADAKNLPKTLGGYGITIVTTSRGVLTDEQARKLGVGGEVLCQVW